MNWRNRPGHFRPKARPRVVEGSKDRCSVCGMGDDYPEFLKVPSIRAYQSDPKGPYRWTCMSCIALDYHAKQRAKKSYVPPQRRTVRGVGGKARWT